MDTLFEIVGYVVYFSMAALALWGAFCVVLVWQRVSQTRFSDEEEQDEFFEELDAELRGGNFSAAAELCDGDPRAMPQLSLFAIENRGQGLKRVRRQLTERFQQDVLGDIEHRLSWVSTVIKSAPMIGLFGTVVGMMGAFSNLAEGGANVDTGQMASDIMFALITTACGLATAVPLVLCSASINVRIRKMEDLIAAGLSRLMDSLATALGGEPSAAPASSGSQSPSGPAAAFGADPMPAMAEE